MNQFITGTRELEPFKSAGFFVQWFGPVPMAFAFSPEVAQAVLSSPQNLDRSFLYRMTVPGLGGSSVSERYTHKWKPKRKILETIFHASMLDKYNPIIDKNAKALISRLMDKFSSESKTRTEVNDISHYFTNVAADILLGEYISYTFR